MKAVMIVADVMARITSILAFCNFPEHWFTLLVQKTRIFISGTVLGSGAVIMHRIQDFCHMQCLTVLLLKLSGM